jgi:hypothetical protein
MLAEKLKREKFTKQTQRMLRDPLGREVLGQSLGLQIGFVEEEKDMKRVAVLVPSYRSPHPRMIDATGIATRHAQQFAQLFYPPRVSSCVIHWVRNHLIAELYKAKTKFTHVCFIDDDIVLAQDHIARLLEHNVDIVAGLCTRRTDPPIPNLRSKHENGDYTDTLVWPNHGGLIEVDAIGTGFMVISKVALDRIAEFYMNCEYEKLIAKDQFPHLTEEQLAEGFKADSEHRRSIFEINGNAWWFQFLPQLKRRNGEYGEDISFCLKANLAGLKVYCDTAVQPFHMGDYPYCYEDYIPHREAAINFVREHEAKPESVLRLVTE